MEGKNSLKPVQKAILGAVEKYPGLSIKELASELRESLNVIWNNVNVLEFRLDLLETWKRENVKQVYLKNRAPLEKFALDELEVRILEAKHKKPQEIAQELGESIPMPVEVRVITSIPTKFKVATFEEAKAIFRKHKKAPAALIVV